MPGTYTFLEALDDAVGDELLDVFVCFQSEFRLDDKGVRDCRALDLLALHHRRLSLGIKEELTGKPLLQWVRCDSLCKFKALAENRNEPS